MAPRHLSATPAPPSRRGGPRSLRTAWSTGPQASSAPGGEGPSGPAGLAAAARPEHPARPPASLVPGGGPSTPPCKPRGTWWWLVAQALTTLMKRLPWGRPHTKRPVAVKSAGPDPASRARRCFANTGLRALPPAAPPPAPAPAPRFPRDRSRVGSAAWGRSSYRRFPWPGAAGRRPRSRGGRAGGSPGCERLRQAVPSALTPPCCPRASSPEEGPRDQTSPQGRQPSRIGDTDWPQVTLMTPLKTLPTEGDSLRRWG